mgnify:CR=1 FL=1
MSYSPGYKTRNFVSTMHIKNFENLGIPPDIYNDPKLLAATLLDIWEQSLTTVTRTGACAVCMSKAGLYHAHLALHSGNTTTLGNVAKLFGNAHTEPQLGGKQALSDYIEKNPPYDEKGEDVLYVTGLDNIKDRSGNRSDLENIKALLDEGYTPDEIFVVNFGYRRFENMIRAEFVAQKIRNAPLKKKMQVFYHFGQPGCGKSHTYYSLAQMYGRENIYMMSDFQNGGLDNYINAGCPRILFMDELRGTNINYATLLNILDECGHKEIHSRYRNVPNLWTEVHITTILSPEELYNEMLVEHRESDNIRQLLRRITFVMYHWRQGNDFFAGSISGDEYTFKAHAIEECKKNGHRIPSLEEEQQLQEEVTSALSVTQVEDASPFTLAEGDMNVKN